MRRASGRIVRESRPRGLATAGRQLRELPLDARASVGSDIRRMRGVRGQHEPVAWSQRERPAIGEHEIDRAARAIEQLRVAVLVSRVAVAWAVRPAVDIACFAPYAIIDPGGVRLVAAYVLHLHGGDDTRAATYSMRAHRRRVPTARERYGSRCDPRVRAGGRAAWVRAPRRVRPLARCRPLDATRLEGRVRLDVALPRGLRVAVVRRGVDHASRGRAFGGHPAAAA